MGDEWQERFWGKIQSTTYDWNYRKKLADMVKLATLDDVRDYFQKVFLGTSRRVLAVQLFTPGQPDIHPSDVPYNMIDSLDVLSNDPQPYTYKLEMRRRKENNESHTESKKHSLSRTHLII